MVQNAMKNECKISDITKDWTQDIITWKLQKNQQKIKTKMDWKRLNFQPAENCSLGQLLKKSASFFFEIVRSLGIEPMTSLNENFIKILWEKCKEK